ncbi:MAG: hypothetical protein J0H34_07885 [Rhizobiales bacterium]|nr:hypothetical protein [Hyphomicrobiales bacterium]
MPTAKPWYLSRTIWASLITVATSVLGLTGMSLDGVDNVQLTDTVLQAVTALAGIVAVLGRIGAAARIG